MVLAARRRRSRARVLDAVGAGASTLSRGPEWTTWFVGGRVSIAHNCVHRWARATPDAVAAVGLGEDGSAPRADLRRALARGDAAGGGARRARRRAGRPRRDLPADVAGGGDRVARVRARRRDPGAGLLRLRRARGRAAAAGERGEGRDHAARVVAARQARCRCSRSSSRRAREAPALEHVVRRAVARARRRLARRRCPRSRSTRRRRTCSPTRPARPASRRASCTCRAASSSRSRARPPTRPTSHAGDVIHFATDMGWIMGPWTLVGAGALGATIVFAEGAPDWPADRLWRTVEDERVTSLGLRRRSSAR